MHLDVVIPSLGLLLTGFMLRRALLGLREPDGKAPAEPLVRPVRGSPPIWREWVGPDSRGGGHPGSPIPGGSGAQHRRLSRPVL